MHGWLCVHTREVMLKMDASPKAKPLSPLLWKVHSILDLAEAMRQWPHNLQYVCDDNQTTNITSFCTCKPFLKRKGGPLKSYKSSLGNRDSPSTLSQMGSGQTSQLFCKRAQKLSHKKSKWAQEAKSSKPAGVSQ